MPNLSMRAKAVLAYRIRTVATLLNLALNQPSEFPVEAQIRAALQHLTQLQADFCSDGADFPIAIKEQIVALLRENSDGLSARQLYREFHVPQPIIAGILDQMVIEQTIEPVQGRGKQRRLVTYRFNKPFSAE